MAIQLLGYLYQGVCIVIYECIKELHEGDDVGKGQMIEEL